jgi:aryl-alcohol dehydrogenase-like predicted oxidoreductase
MDMDTVTLGNSGLEVSPIAFGTWQLSGAWGRFDEAEATQAIRFARERGVNFFDTAQAYGFGESERVLGRALRDDLDHRRDEVVIATKGGVRIDDSGRRVRDSSPAWLRDGVEKSLEALGVDHIDLYQVHWPDSETPFHETGEALQQMVDEGKIRHLGVSNFGSGQIDELSRTRPVETLQPPYAMLRREVEADVLPYCAEHELGVLVYGPLAHGLLTGTMSPGHKFAAGDWRAGLSEFRGDDLARNLAVVERLEEFARERGYAVSQLAIAWTLANPAVHVAIVG